MPIWNSGLPAISVCAILQTTMIFPVPVTAGSREKMPDCSEYEKVMPVFLAAELCTIRKIDDPTAGHLLAESGLDVESRDLNTRDRSTCAFEVASLRREEIAKFDADPAAWCRKVEQLFLADARLRPFIAPVVRPRLRNAGGWTIQPPPPDSSADQ